MLIITKEGVEALKARLKKPSENSLCREELKKMLEIKETLLWRADAGLCCVGWSLPAHLSWEVQLLEETLQALEGGNGNKAASLLEEFASQTEYS